MNLPSLRLGGREKAAERVPGVLLSQHDVAATLRAAAESYEAMDDLAGAMALHAAANGFEDGTEVPGRGFVLGQRVVHHKEPS